MHSLSDISLFSSEFRNDETTLFYNGDFEDKFMADIISLIDADNALESNEKKKIGFLVAESFQNIVRHGGQDQNEDHEGHKIFGIRKLSGYTQIFTSNIIDQKSKEILNGKLNQIIHLNKDELKEIYIDLLSNGGFSSKGGAGLGLISLVRKSTRPVQFLFTDAGLKDHFMFNLQVDFPLGDKLAKQNALTQKIQTNVTLSQFILNKNVLFFYRGEFDDDMIFPMMNILEKKVEHGSSVNFNVFHTAVELMHNIKRHGLADEKGRIHGTFSILEFESYFYIVAGNDISEEKNSELKSGITILNKLTVTELDELYRKKLRLSLKNDSSSAQVGLIDLKRSNPKNPFELIISKGNEKHCTFVGIKIDKT